MGFINEKYFKNEDGNQIDSVEQFVAGTDEQVLYKVKPDKKAHIWESIAKNFFMILIWFAIDVGVLVGVFGFVDNIELWMKLLVVAFVLAHMTPVWLWLGQVIRAAKQAEFAEYALTETRLIIKTGKFAHDFRAVNYKDINTIEIKRSSLDKMFKVADIYISAKTEKVAIVNIKEVEEVWDRLARLVKQENPQVKI